MVPGALPLRGMMRPRRPRGTSHSGSRSGDRERQAEQAKRANQTSAAHSVPSSSAFPAHIVLSDGATQEFARSPDEMFDLGDVSSAEARSRAGHPIASTGIVAARSGGTRFRLGPGRRIARCGRKATWPTERPRNTQQNQAQHCDRPATSFLRSGYLGARPALPPSSQMPDGSV